MFQSIHVEFYYINSIEVLTKRRIYFTTDFLCRLAKTFIEFEMNSVELFYPDSTIHRRYLPNQGRYSHTPGALTSPYKTGTAGQDLAYTPLYHTIFNTSTLFLSTIWQHMGGLWIMNYHSLSFKFPNGEGSQVETWAHKTGLCWMSSFLGSLWRCPILYASF